MIHKNLLSSKEVIDQFPFNIYWKGQNGLYLGANQASLNVSQVPLEGFIGKNMFDLFPASPKMPEAIEAVDTLVLQQGELYRGVEDGLDPCGNAATYFSFKQPVFEEGKIIGMVGMSINITPSTSALNAHDANQMLSALFCLGNDIAIDAAKG